MATRKNIIDRFAPYPTSEETVTADALYRHLLVGAFVQYLRDVQPFRLPGGPTDANQHRQVLATHIAEWSTLRLLRHVMGLDGIDSPDPGAVAFELWCGYEDGSEPAELLWDWLVEAGFSPEEIEQAYEARTR